MLGVIYAEYRGAVIDPVSLWFVFIILNRGPGMALHSMVLFFLCETH